MHFLVTGHNGFKGSWLVTLLKQRGHTISGISLEPTLESIFVLGGLSNLLEHDFVCDIRNLSEIERLFAVINPDVVIHLAAQPLVRESYRNPILTFESNVVGTLNVLKASQGLKSLKAQLIITTDKVYKNKDMNRGYTEEDELGGDDPYSASKAMADIGTQSWLTSFSNTPTAIARAGNVIGGGDYSVDRLIPDLVRNYVNKTSPILRYPDSVRPWQHVLDCLNGYLLLVDALLRGGGLGAWNFGSEPECVMSVSEVAELFGSYWEESSEWVSDKGSNFPEAAILLLDSKRSRAALGWKDKLTLQDSLKWTASWYKNVSLGAGVYTEMMKDVRNFERLP